MRLGLIDLGTNSVRFDIYEGSAHKNSHLLLRKKIMLRPGKGVFRTGRLQKTTLEDLEIAFLAFQRKAHQLQVHNIKAFATCALREATNREEIIEHIKQHTGIEVEVISGKQEAEWIARGILHFEKKVSGSTALVDIGGGSTEISLCQERSLLYAQSFPLGSARVHELFPLNSSQLWRRRQASEQLRAYIQKSLTKYTKSYHSTSIDRVIGSSGTIKALARLIHFSEEVPELIEFTLPQLHQLTKQLIYINRVGRKNLPGMEPKRTEIITGGAILLEEILNFLKVEKVQWTEYSLRDGLLLEVGKEFNFKVSHQTRRKKSGSKKKAKKSSKKKSKKKARY